MSSEGSGKLFSSEEEWNTPVVKEETRQIGGEKAKSTSSIISSGTLSDPDQERNYVRGFAQRATEPDIKDIRKKGPHTYLKKAFHEGESFYERERSFELDVFPPQGSMSQEPASIPETPMSPYAENDEMPYEDEENYPEEQSHTSSRAGQSMMPEPSERRTSYSDMENEARDQQSHSRRSALAQTRGPRVSYDTDDKYSEASSIDYNDVSNWGHEANSDHGMSLSSGISPRESRPRQRKFDTQKATEALAWAGEKYTQAQIMRREGTAPEHYGVVEDMPTRMAYEQLNVLAGMAGKVQHVIEHNRRVFERRVKAADQAELSRAFKAWRAARYGSIRKQQLLQRAANRIARGSMARAFLAWKDKFNLVDKYLQMKRKGLAVNRMGRMRRAFKEWTFLCHERWWKDQMTAKDNDIERLNRLCRKYENRPVTILGNRRLRACIYTWYDQAWERIRRRQLLSKAARRMAMRLVSAAWNTWFEQYDTKRQRKQHLKRTIGRLMNNKLSRAWGSWIALIGDKRRKELRLGKGLRFMKNQTMLKGWNAWLDFHDLAQQYKRILKHWKNSHMAKAYFRWLAFVDSMKWQRLVLTRAINRMLKKTLTLAFESWITVIDERRWTETTSAKEALDEEVVRLRLENERLRRDNERFVRLIDSGEWGRGRVAELVQAGEVMKGERDALMKLIGSLRREYEAVQEAKAAQEMELGDLKRRITHVGGAGRNRMLVKGGSSFNGLVRQMKQEMADAAAAGQPMDPNRMYEVNKLSMDQVQIFPDGELGVYGVDSIAARQGRFTKPIPVSGKSSPVKRMKATVVPKEMQSQGRSIGGSPFRAGGTASPLAGGRQGMSALEDRIAANRRRPGMLATME